MTRIPGSSADAPELSANWYKKAHQEVTASLPDYIKTASGKEIVVNDWEELHKLVHGACMHYAKHQEIAPWLI